MKFMQYKGYIGTIEADLETLSLFGRLANIRDVVTYEGDTVAAIEAEFRQSVDAYLQSCQELGKTPDKPFKGTFNVRIGEELHRQAAMAAMQRGDQSLNAFVAEAIREKIAHTAHEGAH